MNLRPVGIVYRKDLRELLRDWRAIISMIVVPVIIVPVIMFGIVKFVNLTMKEAPKVMLLGGEDSPQCVAALRKMREFQIVPASSDYTNLISSKKIRAAVDIPKDFDAVMEGDRKTAVRIYTYESEPKSMQAARQLEQFFQQRRDDIVRRRLLAHSLPESFVTPFDIQRTNVASPKQVSGMILGMILPYLMIVMCLGGAIYPSIDMTAGEKERGTLETLLSSPAARTGLVLGKGLAVLTASLSTAVLSLLSNGLAFKFISMGQSAKMPLTFDPLAMAGVCVMIVPLAVFLSFIAVAVGLFARSSKEANTYLQPMLLLAIVPAIAAALPGVDFNYRMALVPVLNISLLCKELLGGTWHWGHVLVVFGAMTVYAALAVAASVAMFKRESVLFRS